MDNITIIQQQQARYERLLAFQEAYEALKDGDLTSEIDKDFFNELVEESLNSCYAIAGKAFMAHKQENSLHRS